MTLEPMAPAPIRVFVEYGSRRIELAQGTTVVGRGIHCGVRFNDPSVSREHLQILVYDSEAVVEDLGGKNTVQLNASPLVNDTRRLQDGDQLRIGAVRFTIRLQHDEPDADDFEPDTITISSVDLPRAAAAEAALETAPAPGMRACPGCRTIVEAEARFCPACGHKLGPRRVSCMTRELPIVEEGADRRREPRLPILLPLLYRSRTVSFEAGARDLSRTGIYVATSMLDRVDTPCSITLLPDGAPATTLAGQVARVVLENDAETGLPMGMGIRFVELSRQDRRWLELLLRQLAPGGN